MATRWKQQIEYQETDYGHILVFDDHIEIFGMTGIGRYEMLASIDYEEEDDIEELIQETEQENREDVVVYRTTKAKLGP